MYTEKTDISKNFTTKYTKLYTADADIMCTVHCILIIFYKCSLFIDVNTHSLINVLLLLKYTAISCNVYQRRRPEFDQLNMYE